MKNLFYAVLVIVGLIMLGGKSPRIALMIAFLIFLGTVTLNIENFKTILKPETYQ